MKRLVQFAVWTLVVIFVIAVAIAVYIATTFDPNHYKPRIVQAVKDKTSRTLKLEGDIKLSFFPNIGATLGRASLSERASDREFAGVDDLRVALKLMPLLSKQVVVDSIEVKGLRANVVRYEDGKTNIDELTGGDTFAAPEGPAPRVSIDIGHIAVDSATLMYTDLAQGATYLLSKLRLRTGRIANGVPVKIDLSFTAQSDKPKIDLETALKTVVSFDPDKQNYKLRAVDLSTQGLAAGIGNLRATVRGDIEANPARKELLISNLAIAATGKRESDDLTVKLDVLKLAAAQDGISGEKIGFEATLNQARSKIVARLDIPGIDGNTRSFNAGGLTAGIDVRQGSATIKARLTSPLAGSAEAKRIKLAKLVAIVTVNNPALPKNPLDAHIEGSALIDLAGQSASLFFAAKFDDSSATGKASFARFTAPFYTFDVNIDQLDADRYLPQPNLGQKQPKQLLDLSALKKLNASGSFKVGLLKVSNVKASNVRIDVKAND